MWAHAFERLWFEILDPSVPKALDYEIALKHLRQPVSACLLGARRRKRA